MVHVVHAGIFSNQELRSRQRALGKQCPVLGFMLQGDDLGAGVDDHFMPAHENGKRTKAEVGIHSLRMGNTVGWHEVIVNTGTQIITLKHEAQDRALFAEGALAAAQFLIGKAPGMYNMNHIVK